MKHARVQLKNRKKIVKNRKNYTILVDICAQMYYIERMGFDFSFHLTLL